MFEIVYFTSTFEKKVDLGSTFVWFTFQRNLAKRSIFIQNLIAMIHSTSNFDDQWGSPVYALPLLGRCSTRYACSATDTVNQFVQTYCTAHQAYTHARAACDTVGRLQCTLLLLSTRDARRAAKDTPPRNGRRIFPHFINSHATLVENAFYKH